MQLVFVMDPAEKMLPDKDTTFAFLRAARAARHQSFHCLPSQVHNVGREVSATVRPIAVSDQAPHTELGDETTVDLASVDAVFIRKDPPFDRAYLYLTQQLDLVKDRTLVVNDPTAIRTANEKLYAFEFAHLMPRTIVSADVGRLFDFLRDVGGRGVIKPLDGAGGTGVLALSEGDKNLRSIVDMMTNEGRRKALVQEFLPDVTEGDKRVIVLDGRPLGAILRVPRADDIRANIHVGGRVEKTTLTPTETKLVDEVGETLSRVGLWFVGLDLIGERLIEVNVTSPTGIQELGRLEGTSPEADVIAWVERTISTTG